MLEIVLNLFLLQNKLTLNLELNFEAIRYDLLTCPQYIANNVRNIFQDDSFCERYPIVE